MAAMHAGGFANGIYTTNSPSACQYVAHDSRSNILVVEDQTQLDKILQIKDKLPHLRAIIQFKGKPSVPGVLGWQELLEIGKGTSDDLLDERLRNLAANQCCLLLYTSGTTGNPKGVMFSHDNMVVSSRLSTTTFGWRYNKEKVFSYLPMSHLAGHAEIYWAAAKAGTIVIADPSVLKGGMVENLKHYRPTRFFGVPRVWEKIEDAMRQADRNSQGIKKMLLDWAKSKGTQHHGK